MTAAQYRNKQKQLKNAKRGVRSPRSKYQNHKIELDGKKFDSKKEARRYQELKAMEKAGIISDVQCQVSFILADKVKFSNELKAKPAIRYFADFVYMKDGKQIVEDVKSKATRSLDVYRIKKHLMLSVLGIEIKEI